MIMQAWSQAMQYNHKHNGMCIKVCFACLLLNLKVRGGHASEESEQVIRLSVTYQISSDFISF